jgi:hypothetical protein
MSSEAELINFVVIESRDISQRSHAVKLVSALLRAGFTLQQPHYSLDLVPLVGAVSPQQQRNAIFTLVRSQEGEPAEEANLKLQALFAKAKEENLIVQYS